MNNTNNTCNMNSKRLLIHILWGDTKCDNLKSDLDKIKGIKESFFTEESDISNIAALAEWNNDEIHSRINEIRNIENVKHVDARILVPA